MGTSHTLSTTIIHRNRREIVTALVTMIVLLILAFAWARSRTLEADKVFFSEGADIVSQLSAEMGELLLQVDELRLTNLANQVMQNPRAVYAVVIDHNNIVRGHSDIKQLGKPYAPNPVARKMDVKVGNNPSIYSFTAVDGRQGMDFGMDIMFSGLNIGQVHVGLEYGAVASAKNRTWTTAVIGILLMFLGGLTTLLLIDKSKRKRAQELAGRNRIGPYLLEENIGAGGMAEVFRGKRVGLEGFEKTIAIKRILPHLSNDERFQKMFLTEAKNGAKLNHPNIVQIYDVGNIEGIFFIAMEYIRGRTLAELIKDYGKPFPLPVALFILSSVARALAYAHQFISVHRDLNPQNIMVSNQGEIKIMDFGISKALEDDSGRTRTTGLVIGKIAYMSPEQALGNIVDQRTDVFAFGAVMYEVLTGKRLFSGDTEFAVLNAMNQGVNISMEGIRDDLPAGLVGIMTRSLARDIGERYQSSQALSDDLAKTVSAVPHFTITDMVQFLEELYNVKEAAV